jgi:hypothetical protein
VGGLNPRSFGLSSLVYLNLGLVSSWLNNIINFENIFLVRTIIIARDDDDEPNNFTIRMTIS